MSEEAVVLEICKYMHWDYLTYLEQPQPFISAILARMEAEGYAQEYFMNKYGRRGAE